MIPVILTNIARDDLPTSKSRSPDVYPFFDSQLSHKYRLLSLPSSQHVVSTSTLRHSHHATEKALSHCWASTNITDFAGQKQEPTSSLRSASKLPERSQRRTRPSVLCAKAGDHQHKNHAASSLHASEPEAVLDVITARKSLITRHINTQRRRPIPDISLCSEKQDRERGFAVYFNNFSGKVIVSRESPDGPILGLTLDLMPHLVNKLCKDTTKSSSKAEIRHRGKQGRERLIAICREKTRFLYQLPREFSIQVDSAGHWYLLAAYHLTDPHLFAAKAKERKERKRIDFQGPTNVKAADPGARTFLAVYSSDGQAIDISGDSDRQRLHLLRTQADQVQEKESKKKKKRTRRAGTRRRRRRRRRPSKPPKRRRQRQRLKHELGSAERRPLRKQHRRLHAEMRNLVTEVHARTAHYLALSSDVIIMPRMEVAKMVRSRTLSKRTKRELLGWSHLAFLERLAIKCHDIEFDTRYVHKAETTLLVQPEGYTSKTCSNCGNLHQSLGSNKRFLCPSCPYQADRDHNGAFNMVIKAIR